MKVTTTLWWSMAADWHARDCSSSYGFSCRRFRWSHCDLLLERHAIPRWSIFAVSNIQGHVLATHPVDGIWILALGWDASTALRRWPSPFCQLGVALLAPSIVKSFLSPSIFLFRLAIATHCGSLFIIPWRKLCVELVHRLSGRACVCEVLD